MMKVKKSLFLWCAFLLLMPLVSWGQNRGDDSLKSIKNNDIADQGFEFFVGAGIYKGGKASAGYYSGIPRNENNLDYIFNNKYWKDEIVNLIVQRNSFVSYNDSTIGVKEYPADVKYSPSMSITLGFSYKFSKNWGLTFSYSYSQCVVKDFFTVAYDNAVPSNLRNDYLLYMLLAKEKRSFFDLSARYLFQASKVVKPFLEIGAQFNYVKVKSFEAIIEDTPYSLLDVYGGESYVPGAAMQTFKVIYGGPGFGFSAVAGLKIMCNQSISLDPLFYMSISKIGLKDYKDFGFNWGVSVRIVMGDSFLTK